MKRHRTSFVLGLVALCLGFPVGQHVEAKGLQEESDGKSTLQQCTSEKNSLSILFLIDSSKSLKVEDPFASRAAGIELALDNLTRKVESENRAGRNFSLNGEFLLFGTTTRRAFPGVWPEWGELTGPEIPQNLRSSIRSLGTESNDADTDYLSALDPWLGRSRPLNDPRVGALEVLAAAPVNSCRLMVWFTDGRFDFDPPDPGEPSPKAVTWTDSVIRTEDDAKRVRDEGYATICRSGGPIDALRAGDIFSGSGADLAVVALGDPGRFQFIERLISNSQGNCGSEAPRGTVYQAESIEDLIFKLMQSVTGEEPVDGTTCKSPYKTGESLGKNDCEVNFNLSAGIGSFDLLLLLGGQSVQVQLIDPGGNAIDLASVQPTATMPNGTRLTSTKVSSVKNLVSISGALSDDPNDWAGTWTLRFWSALGDDLDAINRSLVYVFQGDLSARLRDRSSVLRKSSSNRFVVELISSSKNLVNPSLASPLINIQLRANGKEINVGQLRDDGTWEVDFEIGSDFNEDQVSLTAELSVSVKVLKDLPLVEIGRWSKIDLGSLTVKELPKYPLIDAPISEFSNALSQRDNRSSATVEVKAPENEGGGCISLLEADDLKSPDGTRRASLRVFSGTNEISVGRECAIEVSAGETLNLSVEAETVEGDFAVNDSVFGSLVFSSTSTIDPSQSEIFSKDVVVVVAPSMIVSPNYFRALLLSALALVLAIAVLYLLSWYDARVDLGASSLVVIPVVFREGRLFRTNGTSEVEFGYRDEEVDRSSLPGPGKYRSVRTNSVVFRGCMSRSPFGEVSAKAESPSGLRVVSANGSSENGKAGLLSASLHKGWAFVFGDVPKKLDEKLSEVHGELSLIVDSDFAQAREDVRQLTPGLERSLNIALSAQAVPELAIQKDHDIPTVEDPGDSDVEPKVERVLESGSSRPRKEKRRNRVDEETVTEEAVDFDLDDPY